MTIQFIDVPLPVCAWYAEKAPELHMTTLELMAHVLTLWPETGKALKAQPGPGAFYTPEPLGAAIESGAFIANLDTPGTWFVSDDMLQDTPFGGGS